MAEDGLHILMTIHHYLDKNTGAPGVTWRVAEAYRHQGHTVSVLSYDDLPAGIPGKLLPYFFPWYVARHVRKHGKDLDVVDASTGDAWVWAVLFQSPSNGPLLVTRSHGLEHRYRREQLQELQRRQETASWRSKVHWMYLLTTVAATLRRADVVLLLNREDRRLAVDQLSVRPERTEVVRNGIPESFTGLPFRPTPEHDDTSLRIAVIGAYVERKGKEYMIEALNRFLPRHPDVRVTFLGTGRPAAEVLPDFEARLHGRLTVIDYYEHEKLPEHLDGHHIKLLPSLSEGFGVALIEAMACGLAPIATDTQGPREILQSEENGLLIPPRSASAIEEALERLVANRELLDRLRREAHATAQRYGWPRIAADTIDLYRARLRVKEDKTADVPSGR